MLCSEANKRHGLLASSRSSERGLQQVLPQSPQKEPRQEFGFQNSRTVRRYIFCTFFPGFVVFFNPSPKNRTVFIYVLNRLECHPCFRCPREQEFSNVRECTVISWTCLSFLKPVSTESLMACCGASAPFLYSSLADGF